MIPKEPSDATRSGGFPQFPGEEVLSHAAALFLEKAEARLATVTHYAYSTRRVYSVTLVHSTGS